jgi:hypothetical protein
MRPQVGKRANMYKAPREKVKTKTRLFVESRMKYSIAMKDDYLTVRDVATAINMNALEQRIIARESALALLNRKMTRQKIMEKIEEQNGMDRHRLGKFYKFLEK